MDVQEDDMEGRTYSSVPIEPPLTPFPFLPRKAHPTSSFLPAPFVDSAPFPFKSFFILTGTFFAGEAFLGGVMGSTQEASI